jgi:hypothetical protein
MSYAYLFKYIIIGDTGEFSCNAQIFTEVHNVLDARVGSSLRLDLFKFYDSCFIMGALSYAKVTFFVQTNLFVCLHLQLSLSGVLCSDFHLLARKSCMYSLVYVCSGHVLCCRISNGDVFCGELRSTT